MEVANHLGAHFGQECAVGVDGVTGKESQAGFRHVCLDVGEELFGSIGGSQRGG